MAITREQIRQIQVVSNDVLYQQALDFFHIDTKTSQDEQEERPPLTNTQVNGLLNMVQASTYEQLLDFVKHQYNRNWRDKSVSSFYQDLEPVLKNLPALAQEEGILTSSLPIQQANEEKRVVHLLLARELIQHIAAENMVK